MQYVDLKRLMCNTSIQRLERVTPDSGFAAARPGSPHSPCCCPAGGSTIASGGNGEGHGLCFNAEYAERDAQKSQRRLAGKRGERRRAGHDDDQGDHLLFALRRPGRPSARRRPFRRERGRLRLLPRLFPSPSAGDRDEYQASSDRASEQEMTDLHLNSIH